MAFDLFYVYKVVTNFVFIVLLQWIALAQIIGFDDVTVFSTQWCFCNS